MTDRRPHKDVVLKSSGWMKQRFSTPPGFEDPDFPNGWILEEFGEPIWDMIGFQELKVVFPLKKRPNIWSLTCYDQSVWLCFSDFLCVFFRDLFIAQTQSNQGVHCAGPAGPIALWWTLHKWHGTWYLYPYKWTPSPMWSNETVTNLK